MIKRVLQVLLSIALACYPLVIYLGLETLPLNTLAAVILGIFVLRLLVLRGTQLRFLKHLSVPVALSGIVLASASLILNSEQALLFYPVLASFSCLITFAWSLFRPPSIIECFARLTDDELDQDAIIYTRKVTMIWCLFFIANGVIALFTIFNGNYALWTLYNGLLSYIFMGTLFAGEWLYRKWILKV